MNKLQESFGRRKYKKRKYVRNRYKNLPEQVKQKR